MTQRGAARRRDGASRQGRQGFNTRCWPGGSLPDWETSRADTGSVIDPPTVIKAAAHRHRAGRRIGTEWATGCASIAIATCNSMPSIHQCRSYCDAIQGLYSLDPMLVPAMLLRKMLLRNIRRRHVSHCCRVCTGNSGASGRYRDRPLRVKATRKDPARPAESGLLAVAGTCRSSRLASATMSLGSHFATFPAEVV